MCIKSTCVISIYDKTKTIMIVAHGCAHVCVSINPDETLNKPWLGHRERSHPCDTCKYLI